MTVVSLSSRRRESLGPLGLSRTPLHSASPSKARSDPIHRVEPSLSREKPHECGYYERPTLIMQARELVELAALVSAHGPVLVRGGSQLSATGIEQYWAASKCRLDRWARSLKRISTAAADPDGSRSQSPALSGVLEEILTGEVLTRVWTAVMCAYDRHRGTDQAEPIVRSVLIGHMEARHRVLTILVRGPGIDAEQAVKLNRLRRRTERWTDLLVGYLASLHDVSEFAIDPDRAHDFAEDLHYRSRLAGGQQTWPLVLASIRASFRRGPGPLSPNADLNNKIAVSILSCFQSELFDSTGLFRSLWLLRLSNVSDDAQAMLDELISPQEPRSRHRTDESTLSQLTDRLRRLGND